MKTYDAVCATSQTYELAEGPVWDRAGARLLWVDIPAGNVHEGLLEGESITPTETHHVDLTVGAVASAPGGLLVAGHHDVWLVDESGICQVAQLIPEGKRRRLNDGKCDPAGRFLVGSLSLGEETGESLYVVDARRNVEVLDDDLQMSNGLAWSPDGGTLYSVDTTPGIVWSRSYDPVSGVSGSRHEAFRVTGGLPDGICIDADGNLWVAVWGAGEVRLYTPDGRQIAVVGVPAPHTSCVTFAGPGLDQLVITTARVDLVAEQLESFPDSGGLFIARVETPGLPAANWQP